MVEQKLDIGDGLIREGRKRKMEVEIKIAPP